MVSTRGPFVPLESVEWLPEVSTRVTPEDLLIAREEEDDDEMAAQDYAAIRELAADKLKDYVARIPPSEGLALMLHLGLLGYPPTYQDEIAEMLGVESQQVVSYKVRRARKRILYLATRPAVDFKLLSRFLSPQKLEIVREVYETASFAEVAKRRWPCFEDRTREQVRAWNRVRSNRIKRDFFRAVAKIAKRPELAEQLRALGHLIEHLGSLSHHTGKGSWRK